MAKLYAELASDKGGRPIGKGGHDNITLSVYNGNSKVATVAITRPTNNAPFNTSIHVTKHSESTTVGFTDDNIPF